MRSSSYVPVYGSSDDTAAPPSTDSGQSGFVPSQNFGPEFWARIFGDVFYSTDISGQLVQMRELADQYLTTTGLRTHTYRLGGREMGTRSPVSKDAAHSAHRCSQWFSYGKHAGDAWHFYRTLTRAFWLHLQNAGRLWPAELRQLKRPPPRLTVVAVHFRTVWCGQEDSNFHGLSPTTTSTLRVYQFRHGRTSTRGKASGPSGRSAPLAKAPWRCKRAVISRPCFSWVEASARSLF